MADISLSFEWSEMPDLPIDRTYTARQVRVYRIIERLNAHWWHHGRLKPWTLRAGWYGLLARYTQFNQWRFQMAWDANLKTQSKRIADEIDARIEKLIFDDAMMKAFAPNAEIQKVYDPENVPIILRTPRPHRGDLLR